MGAGTLVHVGRFDLIELAVVLEPEEPLRMARRAFYTAMVALRDALISHAPPERPIVYTWPDSILVDGGLVGGGRLAWSAGTAESETPEWLVFGACIRTVAIGEAGLRPLMTALAEEGFDDLTYDRLVESFARHLMFAIDNQQTDGFAVTARNYVAHLAHEKGSSPTLDDVGDLLVRWRGQQEPDRHVLTTALTAPSWLDPATGGPRA
jgi:hypothetical protein